MHKHVAVSNNYGDINIFDYTDFSAKICVLYAPKEWVESMRYSPDGQFLAVGAHDDTIYIYHISPEGKYSSWMKYDFIHSSAITGIDWSKDSKYLRAID
jgi:microtubule-associated protein-like 1/2